MASTKYTYSISGDTANGKVYSPTLVAEIEASSIVTSLEQVETTGDVLDIWFADALSAGDQTTLDGVVAAHQGVIVRSIAVPAADNVLDKDLATPPGTPATGARYIVAATATGAWAGRETEIAEWNGSEWVFYVPGICSCYVEDEGAHYQFDGTSWSSDLAEVTTCRFAGEHDNGSSGAADTIDWNNGQKQLSTLSANCTYTFTPPSSGVGNFLLRVVQGAGGFTITWPSSVKWPGGTAPDLSSQTGGEVNVFSFYYNGTDYYGQGALDFS
jgi:hypothetical protein